MLECQGKIERPSSSVLSKIQDKLVQKDLANTLKILNLVTKISRKRAWLDGVLKALAQVRRQF